MEKYIPRPIDTSKIELNGDILELCELLAKNTHEIWARGKMAAGWTYGEKLNAAEKKHPDLVPYDQLTEAEKDYDRNTSQETLKVMLALGFKITK